MPFAPPHPCSRPGCPHLVSNQTPCPDHGANWASRQRQRDYDATRGTSSQRGYDSQWKRLRDIHIQRHPICEDPFGVHGGRFAPATCVDHITPHKGKSDPKLYDPSNLRSLCDHCHNRKTASQDGGFGNPKQK